MQPLLSLRGMKKSFFGLHAFGDCCPELGCGEVRD
jgi:hypothetical protein